MILKKKERLNYTPFALKVSDGDDTEYDKDQIEILEKVSQTYLKNDTGNEKKETNQKKWVTDKSQNGCYKCGKTDYHVKNCP